MVVSKTRVSDEGILFAMEDMTEIRNLVIRTPPNYETQALSEAVHFRLRGATNMLNVSRSTDSSTSLV